MGLVYDIYDDELGDHHDSPIDWTDEDYEERRVLEVLKELNNKLYLNSLDPDNLEEFFKTTKG